MMTATKTELRGIREGNHALGRTFAVQTGDITHYMGPDFEDALKIFRKCGGPELTTTQRRYVFDHQGIVSA